MVSFRIISAASVCLFDGKITWQKYSEVFESLSGE
jgi:hypothetical protein